MQFLGASVRNWNSGNTVHVSHLCNSVGLLYYQRNYSRSIDNSPGPNMLFPLASFSSSFLRFGLYPPVGGGILF